MDRRCWVPWFVSAQPSEPCRKHPSSMPGATAWRHSRTRYSCPLPLAGGAGEGYVSSTHMNFFKRLFGRAPADSATAEENTAASLSPEDAAIVDRIRQVEKCWPSLQSLGRPDESGWPRRAAHAIANASNIQEDDVVVVGPVATGRGPSFDLLLYVNPPRRNPLDTPRVLLFADGTVELSLRTAY